MASTASGAVFFLGTRAHYQALQPPDSAQYDAENGNEPTDCGWIHCAKTERSGSDMLLLEYCCEETPPSISGVTRRLRGKRAQDSPNGRVIDEDLDPVGLHNITYRGDSVKSKQSAGSGRCASLRALLGSLRARRKRKLSLERLECVAAAPPACTYRDSCRCLDCQSRYFECDESDSDYSVSSGNYNDYDYDCEDIDYSKCEPMTAAAVDNAPSTSRDHDNRSYDDEEVFIDSPPDNLSADLLIDGTKSPAKEKMSVSSDEVTVNGNPDFEDPLELEMAAGTPVVLDYLLNHPITCSIQ